MQTPLPITKELLLIGGGHAHALVLRMWGMNPLPGVRVTVINPEATAPYSGMLPGFVAGHYSRDELDIDLVRLARFAGARLIRGRAEHIDVDARLVTLQGGRQLSYNIAALDIGITSEMPDLPGFSEHAVPAKPLDRFASDWAQYCEAAKTAKIPPSAAIIGGGIAGVELAMAMAHSLKNATELQPGITLIDQSNILPNMSDSNLRFFRKHLKSAGVEVLENTGIAEIHADHLALADGTSVNADFITGAAGARAQDWLVNSALTLHQGYVSVDATLRSVNAPEVFAVGDCAHLCHAPRPKAGVYAVREAPVLFANLRAALSGGVMQKFNPQNDYLKLISLGEKSAFADKWGIKISGAAAWRLKDRIDRSFMDQFHELKPMPSPEIPIPVAQGVTEILDDAPLCGGCGSKIGNASLTVALSKLALTDRADIFTGPGDDAATLKGPDGQYQVISTDHLRAFTSDPATMARIAAIHALGDIWAMGAEPQSALASITLPRLSPELQQAWLSEIMVAANDIFSAEGAAIVGGHSAQGAELSIGFTVTGLRGTQPIGKSGAKPGNALILTKPIGCGVIMAGEMALKARGVWVLAALESMGKPLGDVAQVLDKANAMTDVTGFGLAGHLNEIASASGVGIALDLAEIPTLNGALELADMGIHSSIFRENRALAPGLKLPDTPMADLLFDPQTAGGLLAAVSARNVAVMLNKLNVLGCDAKVIGHCTKPSLGLHLI